MDQKVALRAVARLNRCSALINSAIEKTVFDIADESALYGIILQLEHMADKYKEK